MQVTIEIPEDLGIRLEKKWGNLSQRTLEAIALEAYRVGVMTSAEIQELLKIPSRWETEEFLQQSQAYLDYTEEDLLEDRETWKKVLL
ncbi:MAG TPA: UPF0175 family protein [Allocoleopsis sp.]